MSQMEAEQKELLLLIGDSVARFLADEYGFDQRMQWLSQGQGFHAEHWRRFAELGWLGASVPHAYGGIDGGLMAAGTVAGRFGRRLVVSPYLPLMGAMDLILRLGSAAQRQRMLVPMVQGDWLVALAVLEPAAHFKWYPCGVKAVKQAGSYRLYGTKIAVLFADVCKYLLVPARSIEDGSADGAGAIDSGHTAVFVVDTDTAGVCLDAYPTHSGAPAADVQFDGVVAHGVLGDGGDGTACAVAAVDTALDSIRAVACADTVGSMWAAQEATLDYLKVREQFGAPLSSFQALQHRLVDMYMHCELSQSMADAALEAADTLSGAPRRAAIAAACYKISVCARQVGEEAVQLHGGVGMMEALPIGHHLMRTTANDQILGDADYHLARFRECTSQ